MNAISRDVIDKALEKYRNSADSAEQSAAYNGSMHDGGAGLMRAQAIAYEDGLDGKIPSFLMPFIKQINREEDPDYRKYLELKGRFE